MLVTTVTPVAHRASEAQMLLLIRCADAGAAMQCIDCVFLQEGYAKEKDAPDGVLYGRGSKACRLLGGAFSGRHEFRVRSEQDGELTLLSVMGTATVATAGAIGVSKMRKELARLSGLILGQFPSCPAPQEVEPGAMGRFAAVVSSREAGCGGDYLMVIILVLIAAVAGGLAAAWALIKK